MIKLGFIFSLVFALTSNAYAVLPNSDKADIGIYQNKIYNSGAEQGAVKWSGYADAAGATPVDATGGSPTTTITSSITSPMEGLRSFLITKAASNRQGDGISTTTRGFTAADYYQVFTINFDYAVASGTFVPGTDSTAGDLQVWIYDVDNAALISPSDVKIRAQSGHYTATFQTSNSASYRVALHVSGTTTSAWTFRYDNFNLVRQDRPRGPPITDWQLYAPTILGFGTISNNTAYWKREGDTLLVRGSFTSGTETAVLGTIPLPSSLNVGTLSITNTTSNPGQMVGAYTNGTNNNQFGYLVGATSTSTSNIYFGATLGAGTGAFLTPQLANGVISGTPVVSYSFRVPILGWSSSVDMSSSSDSRVVAALIPFAATTVGTSATQLVLGTPIKDSHGARSSNQWTAPIPGYYKIGYSLAYAGSTAAAANRHLFRVSVDGTPDQVSYSPIPIHSSVTLGFSGSVMEYLNAGQVLTFFAQRPDVSTAIVVNNPESWVSIERIGGSSTLAATETVAARYINSTTSCTNGSVVTVIHPTKVYDTHGAYNTSTGIFTAPIAGKYRTTNSIGGIAFGTSSYAAVKIQKNGVDLNERNEIVTGTARRFGQITAVVDLLQGDTLQPLVDNATGSTGALLTGFSSFTVERIGN